MSADSAAPQAAFDSPIEGPPDCYAEHIAELPAPGSRILKSQGALAAALAYNSASPDQSQNILNLLENLFDLADQNEVLSTYSKQIHAYATQLQATSSASEDELARIKSTVAKLTTQLAEAQTEASDEKARVQSLLEKHASRSAEAGQLRVRVRDLETELKATAVAHDVLLQEGGGIKSKLSTAMCGLEELKASLAAIKTEQDEELDRAKCSYQLELGKVKSELERASNSEKDLLAQNSSLDAEIISLRGELVTGKGAHESALQTLGTQLGQSETALQEQQRICAEYAGEIKHLKTALETSQKACEDWQSKVDSTNSAAARAVSDMQNQRNAAHERVKEMETKLEAEAATSKQEIEKLADDLAKSQAEATASQSKWELAKTAKQDRDRLQSEVEALRKYAEEHKSKLAVAVQERDKAQKDVSSLQRKTDGWKSRFQDEKKSAEESKWKAERLSTKYNELETEVAKLRDELSGATKNNQAQEKAIKALTAERDSIKRERDMKNICHAQQSELMNQEVGDCDLGAACVTQPEKLAKVQRQATTSSEKLSAKINENRLLDFNLRSEIGRLTTRLADARRDLEEGARAKETLSRLGQQYSDLNQDHLQAQDKIARLEDELSEARSQVANLKEQNASLRESDDARYLEKSDVERMRATLKVTEEALEEKEKEINDLRSENDRLCTEFDALSVEKDKVAALTVQLEQDRTVADGRCKALNTQVKLHKTQYDSAKAEVDALKTRLDQRADDATAEAGRFAAEVEGLRTQIAALNEAQQEERARLQAIIDRLRSQVDDQKETIDRGRHFYGWR
ncbi:hypothetical protein AURDEDRAFT_184907 [Auricularia subglabra TFB-10046 SS5]|nr:hypothetical protein AURDEDRAFT_184907 [Auricularia subglabra TFB-10046 SS5]